MSQVKQEKIERTILVEEQIIPKNELLDELSFHCAKLYNQVLYKIKIELKSDERKLLKQMIDLIDILEEFEEDNKNEDVKKELINIWEETGIWFRAKGSKEKGNSLRDYFNNPQSDYNHEHWNYFKQMKLTNVSEQILMLVDSNVKSFFALIKDWKKNPNKYKGMPKFPHFLREQKHIIRFRDRDISYKDHKVIFPTSLRPYLHIGTKLTNDKVSRGAWFKPLPNGQYKLYLLYESEKVELKPFNGKIAGIDVGKDNLLTIVTNLGIKPIVYSGKTIKSVNNFFNMKKAELQSLDMIAKQTSETLPTNKMKQMSVKRQRKIKSMFHKISAHILEYLQNQDICVVVFGANKYWKQNSRMNKKNNREFISIPFYILKEQLKYKCELAGIEFKEQEESYTSKCSFIDNESIKKHSQYLGKRNGRMFESKDGLKINADVNGAYNIIRKQFPKAFDNMQITNECLHPLRVSIQ